MTKIKLMLIFLTAVFLFSCESSTKPESKMFTVTGSIDNVKNVTITDNMNVYVFWAVTATSPDYTYIWGKGTIDKDKKTFKIELPDNPPNEMLNKNSLGVGQILLLDDNNLQNGKLPFDFDRSKFVGIAGWYGIIYKANDSLDATIDWAKKFKNGFSIGEGVEGAGSFDSFKPMENGEVKITIDDLGNIKIVNWT